MFPAIFLANPWLMLIGTVLFGETVILAAIASTGAGAAPIATVVAVAFVGRWWPMQHGSRALSGC